jgi:DNA-damage-inducible protein J
MAKSATARARVEPEVKREAEKILSDCGLTASQAISLFYRQVILERGMPFQIKSFNEKTRRVLKNSEKGIEVEQFESADALFEDLGI